MKKKSAIIFLLSSLVPYTDANLKLTYRPNVFFNELEKISKKETGRKISKTSLKSTYYRAKNDQYFELDKLGVPSLTAKGIDRIAPFKPKKLVGAKLLVTFDIPETQRQKRSQFRQTLRILKFKQVQQSVWISDYDGRDILGRDIEFLGLKDKVEIYEARKI
jgi:hypothetical protein